MPDGYYLSQADYDLFREMKRTWPTVVDILNRVKGLKGGQGGPRVTNGPGGIIIVPQPFSKTPISSGGGGGGGSAELMKVTVASDATTLIASAKKWDGSAFTGTAFAVKMVVPAPIDLEFHAMQVDRLSSSDADTTYIEIIGGTIASPTTIGSSSEGAEAANSDTWSTTNNAPLTEYIHGRTVYDETSLKKLLNQARLRRRNSRGIFYELGAEAQIVVFETESCADVTP